VWKYIRVIDSHWVWQGSVGTRGQMQYWLREPGQPRRIITVPRELWRERRGELDDSVYIVQTCGIERCVKPDHYDLYGPQSAWSRRVNLMRADAELEAAKNGWPYSNARVL
jgi:hypothetical protein